MNIPNLLKKRDTVYGILAIWIVLFHVFRVFSLPDIPVLTDIFCNGNMAVDVFLFLSGLCLFLSAQRHEYRERGWLSFYKNRIFRIIIPYVVICIPLYLFIYFVQFPKGGFLRNVLRFGWHFSSASFWVSGKTTTWFIYAIAVYYLLFPLLYTFAVKYAGKPYVLAGTVAAMLAFTLALSFVIRPKNAEIFWSRIPVFAAGIFMGNYTERFNLEKIPSRIRALVIVSCFLLFSAVIKVVAMSEIEKRFAMKKGIRYFLYFFAACALIICITALGSRFESYRHNLFAFAGGLSLEIYLVHLLVIHIIEYAGIAGRLGLSLYIIVPVVSVILAFAASKLIKLIDGALSGPADRLIGKVVRQK